MQWIVYGLAFGAMALVAWYGAREPQQTKGQNRLFGFLALAAWFLVLVLAKIML